LETHNLFGKTSPHELGPQLATQIFEEFFPKLPVGQKLTQTKELFSAKPVEHEATQLHVEFSAKSPEQ